MLSKEDRARVLELRAAGIGATETARKLGVSRSTVHRVGDKDARASAEVPGPDTRPAEESSVGATSPLRDAMRRAELRARLETMSEAMSDEDGFGASPAHRAFEAALDACQAEVGGAGLPDLEQAVDALGARFQALSLGNHPRDAEDGWDRVVDKMKGFERTSGLPLRALEPVLSSRPSCLVDALRALDRVETLRREAERARVTRDAVAKEARFHLGTVARARGELQAMEAHRWAVWREICWLEARRAGSQEFAGADRKKVGGAGRTQIGPSAPVGARPSTLAGGRRGWRPGHRPPTTHVRR